MILLRALSSVPSSIQQQQQQVSRNVMCVHPFLGGLPFHGLERRSHLLWSPCRRLPGSPREARGSDVEGWDEFCGGDQAARHAWLKSKRLVWSSFRASVLPSPSASVALCMLFRSPEWDVMYRLVSTHAHGVCSRIHDRPACLAAVTRLPCGQKQKQTRLGSTSLTHPPVWIHAVCIRHSPPGCTR